jgi:hypothetical protein
MTRLTVIRRLATFAAVAGGLAVVASCDDPATPPAGAGDPVTITLTPVGGGTAVVSFIVDPDGSTLPDPPEAPSATLTLAKGVTYNGSIALLNDIDPNNVVDINAEVEEEADFHRFFFTITADPNSSDAIGLPTVDASRLISIPVASLNTDGQSPPQPLGTTFQLVVDAGAPSGATTLNVQLHHFESAKGDGLGTVFDTDLNVNFPVTVQ